LNHFNHYMKKYFPDFAVTFSAGRVVHIEQD